MNKATPRPPLSTLPPRKRGPAPSDGSALTHHILIDILYAPELLGRRPICCSVANAIHLPTAPHADVVCHHNAHDSETPFGLPGVWLAVLMAIDAMLLMAALSCRT
jgi:hypothetical protein